MLTPLGPRDAYAAQELLRQALIGIELEYLSGWKVRVATVAASLAYNARLAGYAAGRAEAFAEQAAGLSSADVTGPPTDVTRHVIPGVSAEIVDYPAGPRLALTVDGRLLVDVQGMDDLVDALSDLRDQLDTTPPAPNRNPREDR